MRRTQEDTSLFEKEPDNLFEEPLFVAQLAAKQLRAMMQTQPVGGPLHTSAQGWRTAATSLLVESTAAIKRRHSGWVGGATNRAEPFMAAFRVLLVLHCLHTRGVDAAEVTAAAAALGALPLSPLMADMVAAVMRQYSAGDSEDGEGGFQPCFLL